MSGRWIVSSYSNGNGGNNCVEAKSEGDNVLVRDTKLGEVSPVLIFSQADWQTFIGEIKAGFTCPMGGMIETWIEKNGMTMLNRANTTTRLTFTGDEWRAFLAGAEQGEFDLQPA